MVSLLGKYYRLKPFDLERERTKQNVELKQTPGEKHRVLIGIEE